MINILHVKYAMEVAKTGSLSAASESLLIAQPNLSRAIKSLEADLGITIFDRSPHGMLLTSDGEEFMSYANDIIDKIDNVEAIYRSGYLRSDRFSVSVPRAEYISRAFVAFSQETEIKVEFDYRETDTFSILDDVIHSRSKMGILRYQDTYDKQFRSMLREKELAYENVAEFRPCLIMSENSKIARLSEIRFSDLEGFTEISYGDCFVPGLSEDEVRQNDRLGTTDKHIYVSDRSSAMELLSAREDGFMWSSVMSERSLARYGLVMRDCVDNRRIWRDICIYRKNYRLTEQDRRFLDALNVSKQKYI